MVQIMKVTLFTICMLTLSACTMKVHRGNPQPNVILAANKVPTGLVLDKSVKNKFTIKGRGFRNVQVQDWRKTLQIGFQNAFPKPGKSGYKLHILMAKLNFIPAAIQGGGGVSAIRAIIRFKAKLLSPEGKEISVGFGTVRANQAVSSPAHLTKNVSVVVENFFELLVKKLILKTPNSK